MLVISHSGPLDVVSNLIYEIAIYRIKETSEQRDCFIWDFIVLILARISNFPILCFEKFRSTCQWLLRFNRDVVKCIV